MGIVDKLQTSQGKTFMAYLYGWGASVVILGALFKIQHYPGAGAMLIIGLGTEAIIFFFSAFEPPHEDVEWGLVYPELAHMEDPEDLETGEIDDAEYLPKGPITEQLDRMLEDAKIGPELISSLSLGMKSLSESAHNLTDLSDAAAATNDYTDKVKQASTSIDSMSDAYSKGNQAMDDLASASASVKDNLSNIATSTDSYSASMETAASKMNEMNSAYGQAVGALSEIASSSGTAKDYNDQIQKLTGNLATLNSMYELDMKESNEKLINTINSLAGTSEATQSMTEQMKQLTQSLSTLNSSYAGEAQESKQRTEAVAGFYQGVTEVMENLKNSAEGARRSRDEVSKLGDNLAALNSIYGNMLAAMNVNIGSVSGGGGGLSSAE